MRRFLGFVFVLMFGVSCSAFAWQSFNVSTFTAQAVTSGGSISMSASLNGSGTQLSFTGITIGTTKWKAADNYIVMHSTITNSAGGIQIYTDNTASDAPARFTGDVTLLNPAGLVDSSNTTSTLPMCWRVVDITTSTASNTIMQGCNAPNSSGVMTWYPDRLYSNLLGVRYPCFIWMKDRQTRTIADTTITAFANGDDYVTVKDAIGGIQHAEATRAKVSSPDYIYVGADFTNALGGRTYQANVRLEVFSE